MILPSEGVTLPSAVVWSAGCTGVLTSVPGTRERGLKGLCSTWGWGGSDVLSARMHTGGCLGPLVSQAEWVQLLSMVAKCWSWCWK